LLLTTGLFVLRYNPSEELNRDCAELLIDKNRKKEKIDSFFIAT